MLVAGGGAERYFKVSTESEAVWVIQSGLNREHKSHIPRGGFITLKIKLLPLIAFGSLAQLLQPNISLQNLRPCSVRILRFDRRIMQHMIAVFFSFFSAIAWLKFTLSSLSAESFLKCHKEWRCDNRRDSQSALVCWIENSKEDSKVKVFQC